MFEVKDLTVEIEDKQTLNKLNFEIKPGEVHAIMGPNGSGKSTFVKTVAGHPKYEVTGGEVLYTVNNKKKNVLEMEPDERSKEGLFLAFQYPVEVPGVSNFDFLRSCFKSLSEYQGIAPMKDETFRKYVLEKAKLVDLDASFLDRAVNEGFSGGEKKKNEILQLQVLNPRIAFLDETDSGLDIDALKAVAEGVNKFRSSENAVVLVTHYQRLLNYIEPDYVHVLHKGQVIKTGGKELAEQLEAKGYDWVIKEFEEKNVVL